MANPIYLDAKNVPAILRGSYEGNKFKVHVVSSVSIPMTAGLWDGGSREYYSAIRLSTGQTIPLPNQDSAPWNSNRQENTVELRPDMAIIKHSVFCGKDMGLTFYIHSDNAASLLPTQTDELNFHEKVVLNATCRFKSSYGGRTRYEMAKSEYYGNESFPTREQWEMAKESLVSKGLLNRAGAVTVKGRNQRPDRL